MDKFVGKRLDGRYEIHEIIGVGGMAVVYKARDIIEDRIVAIKILKEEFVTNEEFIRRFKNESKAIAVLSHPNIVKVYDVSFGDLIQYIVMEYIDGMTLKEYIDRQGSLRWKDAVYYVIQILRALQHAHDKGVVHRDVKPQNIMVLPDGTIKVADFGIARFSRSEQRTITDKAIGSVHYISPEQARGERTDEKSDLYSVGVMLYEMLTGKLPFEAESAVSVAIMQLQREPELPTAVNPSIPKGLEQITMHAMQKSPDRRYQSAAEMLCDLEQFKKDPTSLFEHTYFVDDAPTKYVNDVISATPAGAVRIEEDENQADESQEKSKTVPILTGIAIALVVLLIAVGMWVAHVTLGWFGGGSKSAEAQCPNFVGMTKEQVEQSDYYLGNDGWKLKVEFQYEKNSDYSKNTVFRQSITADKIIKKTESITLYVSMGQTTVTVPDVYGKEESYAVSELKSKKFVPNVKRISSDTVEENFVIKTDPPRTYVAAEGEEVIVYVSNGADKSYVDVPNTIGLSASDAKKKLERANLSGVVKNYNITKDDTYYKEGYVVKQSPSSSDRALEGSSVTVYVSTGKYEFDVTFSLPTELNPDELHKLSVFVKDESSAQKTVETKINDISEYTFKGLVCDGDSKTRNVTVHIYIDNKLAKDVNVDLATGECTEEVYE